MCPKARKLIKKLGIFNVWELKLKHDPKPRRVYFLEWIIGC